MMVMIFWCHWWYHDGIDDNDEDDYSDDKCTFQYHPHQPTLYGDDDNDNDNDDKDDYFDDDDDDKNDNDDNDDTRISPLPLCMMILTPMVLNDDDKMRM